MKKRVAALSCCLSLVQSSVVAAEDLIEKRPAVLTTAAVDAAHQVGPQRPTSLGHAARALLREETSRAVPPRQDCGRDRGNWMERHPVWAGAMVGFGTGVLMTYAITHDNNEGEFLKVMSPGAGALIWGSVSSGVGALAGWGIGRNRDDGVCRG